MPRCLKRPRLCTSPVSDQQTSYMLGDFIDFTGLFATSGKFDTLMLDTFALLWDGEYKQIDPDALNDLAEKFKGFKLVEEEIELCRKWLQKYG